MNSNRKTKIFKDRWKKNTFQGRNFVFSVRNMNGLIEQNKHEPGLYGTFGRTVHAIGNRGKRIVSVINIVFYLFPDALGISLKNNVRKCHMRARTAINVLTTAAISSTTTVLFGTRESINYSLRRLYCYWFQWFFSLSRCRTTNDITVLRVQNHRLVPL